jgi:N-acetylglucosamine-6-phosphate deacetylase
MVTVRGDLVMPTGIERGWVRVVGDRIEAVGFRDAPHDDEVIETDGLVLPGLVDAHCHGALGAAFGDGADAVRTVAEHHHSSGTTSMLASLVSESPATLAEQVGVLAMLVHEGVVDGIHLEGPYLAAQCRGAHRADALRDPDVGEIAALLDLAAGAITVVTVAPELPDALGLIDVLVSRSVRTALGHTAATTRETRAAIDAGARIATHLFNGMTPLHQRNGGPVLALLDDERVVCELIADGHHVDADVVRWVWRVLGPARRMLVSDSSPATGIPDGAVTLGGQELLVSDGVVRTLAGGALAGSTSTLMDVVRWAVSIGIPLHEAVTAASVVPAPALGLADRGELRSGRRADLLLTDRGLGVDRVLRGGRWL